MQARIANDLPMCLQPTPAGRRK